MAIYIPPIPEGQPSSGVAPGGLEYQYLRKASDISGDTEWANPDPQVKALTITSPSDSEKVVLLFTTEPVVLQAIRSVVTGVTPSITFSIRYGTDVSTAGTEVKTGGITTTNTTTGLSTTTLDDPSIPGGVYIWLTTAATSGTVDLLNVSLVF
jgi:hypothetical protein